MTHARALYLLLVVASGGCGNDPSLPSEDEAREAFAHRSSELTELEAALRREITTVGLDSPAAVCSPPDDPACLTVLGQRYRGIEEAQAHLQVLLTRVQPVCAEVTVTSSATRNEDLRASINTCDPGRRGDSVEPSGGVPVSGFQVGRGVYSLAGGDFHPGIAVDRSFTLGNARASMRLFFFSDGTLP